MNEPNLQGLLREPLYVKPVRCDKCGGFYKYEGLGEYICEKCGYRDYDSYGKVRAYLECNPGASVVQTEAATGVPQKLIYKMVSDGKFDIKTGGK